MNFRLQFEWNIKLKVCFANIYIKVYNVYIPEMLYVTFNSPIGLRHSTVYKKRESNLG